MEKKVKSYNRKITNETQRKNWLITQLRSISIKYPPRLSALEKAKTIYYIKAKNGNDVKRVSFTCKQCGKTGLKNSEKHMDHKIPVVDQNGFNDWNHFIEGLFPFEENWQCLCIPCHEIKSKSENEQRYFIKKENK